MIIHALLTGLLVIIVLGSVAIAAVGIDQLLRELPEEE